MLILNFNGNTVCIDEDDLNLYLTVPWNIGTTTKIKYLQFNGRLFHREVMNATKGIIVDHINGNGLDNRKENLRLVTVRQNSSNTYLRRAKLTSSRYFGVTQQKTKQGYRLWRTRFWLKEEGHISLGVFSKEVDAAKAYNSYALARFPDFPLDLLNDLNVTF